MKEAQTNPGIISLCTVSMNRLHHLKATLLENLKYVSEFEKSHIVLLDYNSADGTKDWILQHCRQYIDQGWLIYYHTLEPISFNRVHSKNMAVRACFGTIVSIVDADNFIGPLFLHEVKRIFEDNCDVFATTINANLKGVSANNVPNDVLGRICFLKSDFLRVGGYDERMTKYGFEDYDIADRLERLGLQRILITNPIHLRFIAHDSDDRFGLPRCNDFGKLYIRYITPFSSEIILMGSDNHFIKSLIIDNEQKNYQKLESGIVDNKANFKFSVDNFQKGRCRYHSKSNIISLLFGDDFQEIPLIFHFNKIRNFVVIRGTNLKFFEVSDLTKVKQVVIFLNIIENRRLYEENRNTNLIYANRLTYGCGIVFKNFDYEHAHEIE